MNKKNLDYYSQKFLDIELRQNMNVSENTIFSYKYASIKKSPPEYGTDGDNEGQDQGETVRLPMGMGLFLFRDIPGVGVNDESVLDLKDSAEALFFFPSPLPVAARA